MKWNAQYTAGETAIHYVLAAEVHALVDVEDALIPAQNHVVNVVKNVPLTASQDAKKVVVQNVQIHVRIPVHSSALVALIRVIPIVHCIVARNVLQ